MPRDASLSDSVCSVDSDYKCIDIMSYLSVYIPATPEAALQTIAKPTIVSLQIDPESG